MKRTRSHERGPADIGSTMTPMIDVVFLLLVFFVWTYSVQAIESILPSRLSSQAGSEPVSTPLPRPEDDFEQLVLGVAWRTDHPVWQMNGSELESLQALRPRLETIYSIHAETRVIIHPEGDVPLGHVIQAFDLARLVGFAKVSFAAEFNRPIPRP